MVGRWAALAGAVVVLAAGCTAAPAHRATSAAPSSPSAAPSATVTPGDSSAALPPVSSHVQAADTRLIVAMYTNINRAFTVEPNAGLRALLATQYPGDRSDVSFGRCVNVLAPHAKVLPRTTTVRFQPRVTTITADPSYTVTSGRVQNLHPKGRIYETLITISVGRQVSVHSRHQVILDGKAYQFSAC
jgi:hypothetical protein